MGHDAIQILASLCRKGSQEEHVGSAFLLSDVFAVTCAHVIRDHLGLGATTPEAPPTELIELRFSNLNKLYLAEVVPEGWFPDSRLGGIEQLSDIAILKLRESRGNNHCFNLSRTPPHPETEVRIIGASENFEAWGQYVQGKFASGPSGQGPWPINEERGQGHNTAPGFSGAPVFDAKLREIVGMVQRVAQGEMTVSYAVGADRIREALRATGHHIAICPIDREAGAARAAFDTREQDLAREVAERSFEQPELGSSLRRRWSGSPEFDPCDVEDALSKFREGDGSRAASLLLNEISRRYRQLGELFLKSESKAALQYLREADRLAPDDVFTLALRKDAELAQDRPDLARKTIERALSLPQLSPTLRVPLYTALGDIARQTGDYPTARKAYEDACRISMEVVEAGNGELLRHRDLAFSHNKLGDLAYEAGDLELARTSYQRAHAEIKKLVAQGEGVRAKRELASSHNNLGVVAHEFSQWDDARDALGFAKAIIEELLHADPNNLDLQRDLGVSHERLGDLARDRGDAAAARQAFREALRIRADLIAHDPANKVWQREFAISLDRCGDMDHAGGSPDAARPRFKKALDLREAYACSEAHPDDEPPRVLWSRDLAASLMKLGELDDEAGYSEEARRHLEKASDILRPLVAAVPYNMFLIVNFVKAAKQLAAILEKSRASNPSLIGELRNLAKRALNTPHLGPAREALFHSCLSGDPTS